MTDDRHHRLARLLDPDGRITALAMDQRGSLRRALEAAGAPDVGDDDLVAFKRSVSAILSPEASAILLDPAFGIPAAGARGPDSGLLLAYERTGYDTSAPGRMPRLAPDQSVRRLRRAGADGVKLMVYLDPFDDGAVLERKRAFVERVGAECAAEGMPLFLEPMSYAEDPLDPLERDRRKPEAVRRIVTEFSDPRYRVDVLKIEFPLAIARVDGLGLTTTDPPLYDRAAAIAELRRATAEAAVPFVFLSAGVDTDLFVASLTLAGEAGVPYSGILCGRATWKGGIGAYARGGEGALRVWLEGEGLENIRAVNGVAARYGVGVELG